MVNGDNPRKPFVIGGNDKPWRVFGAGFFHRIFISIHIIVPKTAFFGIRRREFPVFFGSVNAFQKSLFLLFFGNIQEKFQNVNAVFRQISFKMANLLKAFLPNIFVIFYFFR